MVPSTRRLRGARHADISSRVERRHIVARHAVQTILVFFAVDVTIPAIIQDIWFISTFHLEIVDVVTAVILKLGEYLFTAQFIPNTKHSPKVPRSKQLQFCPRSLSRVYE